MSEHLDMDALAQLKEIMGEDFETLKQTFERDSVVRIQSIKNAIASGNPDEIRRAAHSFKGSAGNMAAPQLTELCRALEDQGRDGQVAGCDTLLKQIEAEYQHVRQALSAFT